MRTQTASVPVGDVLEILFSNRNKAYGAYILRREYPETMRKAMTLTAFLIAAAFGLAWWSGRPDGEDEKSVFSVVVGPDVFKLEEKTLPPPPKMEAPKMVRPQVAVVPPRVLEDDLVADETPPTVPADEIPDNAEVGSKTIAGTGDAPPELPGDMPSSAPPTVEEAPKTLDDSEPLTFVSAMPAFPGGEQELLNYLKKEIQYPVLARESGTKGMVVLQFTVERNGEIADVSVLRDIGGGCGKEAVRVVKAMPPWLPGNQNGQKVRVRVTLPIRFELN